MGLVTIFLTALVLSIDAFVCSAICGRKPLVGAKRWTTGLMVGFSFGLFQFLMPVVGFFTGVTLYQYSFDYEPVLVLVLLAIVALNMIEEALFGKDSKKADKEKSFLKFGFWAVLAMAFGSSIDALTVGISYGLLYNTILFASAVIGIVGVLCSFVGFSLGQHLSRFKRFDKFLNISGAIVFMGISLNILSAHILF